MKPLRVTAKLQGVVVLTLGTIALDALLASLYAILHRLPPLVPGAMPEPLPLPLAREPGGRFDLASFSVATFDQYEVQHMHKAFPVDVARNHTKMGVVNQKSGANKSHRIPLSLAHADGDTLTWWCVGDKDGIEDLLQYCHHLGKKRAHGMGKVLEWWVEECKPWGDGFPVMLGGKPLRNLPTDWPGLVAPELRMARITYPYWQTAPGQEICAVPEVE